MIAYSIDGLLLQITDLPRVHKSTILPGTLATLARKIGTHRLNQPAGEDVRSLHVRIVEEKQSQSQSSKTENTLSEEKKSSSKYEEEEEEEEEEVELPLGAV